MRTRFEVEGFISPYDCNRDHSYDRRSNSICLWFGQVCSSSIAQRITPRYSRWVNCARKAVTRMNGIYVSHHISSTIVEHRVWNLQSHSLLCPRRASDRPPDLCSVWREADTSWGRPRATSGSRITSEPSTMHGRIDKETIKLDRRIFSWHGNTTSSNSSIHGSSSKTYFEQSRKIAQFIYFFSERPELRSMQTHESYKRERYAEEILPIGRTGKCRDILVVW